MTGFASIVMLAAACWVIRQAFITLIPAERLPRRITSALSQLPPAVLAALAAVETASIARGDSGGIGLASMGCVALIAVVAYIRPGLTTSAGLGLAAVLLIDLILA